MSQQREKTSITIRPGIWKQAKIEAICDELDVSEYAEEALVFWNTRRQEFKHG